MSLLDSPFFTVIRPFIKIQRYVREGGGSQNPRHRIELKSDIPEALKLQALAFKMPCVACGELIHPFRQRGPARRGVNIGNLYYAACCPLAVNLPCSRGTLASVEYREIAAAIGRDELNEVP